MSRCTTYLVLFVFGEIAFNASIAFFLTSLRKTSSENSATVQTNRKNLTDMLKATPSKIKTTKCAVQRDMRDIHNFLNEVLLTDNDIET